MIIINNLEFAIIANAPAPPNNKDKIIGAPIIASVIAAVIATILFN
tara:strand:+ start:988 stop:1125 length:138 start_codon:yes stop_codon:yes gene_type:complete